ncbi:MAG: response regulator [Chlorobi bacterium]|nr:response regulator [Chlorobiota bacterium]
MKILIVDDIIMNRILLTEIINNLGFEYLEAENGKKAIEILKNTEIDIVLMDIEMPVMNGLETTQYIRTKLATNKSNTPIIALTAHDPNDFFSDFEETGFDHLLTKPYTLNKISEVINEFS